ncbi:5'-methylthioadenosine/S-adenosylhomocysteine nucleosidase family protein [Aspergillus foveolatus]|uniref:5'-methylthioadenosine/S-adenosylhomocysteine nucleosidase family protein n=1 Tax=Aspergillus foveolatus TaxID=210207 RepID=UPI003CCE1431
MFSVGRTLSRRDYTVGLICALHIELAAVRGMLDEIHVDLPVPRSDTNTYILGRMCSHNVVITCLPNGIHGPVMAATAATQMLSTFQSIRFGLMVGIGGGVPALSHQDIRLGMWWLVSRPNALVPEECSALSTLRKQHLLRETRIPEFLSEMLLRYPLMRDSIRRGEDDQLFQADHKHSSPKGSCSNCNKRFVIPRSQRGMESPQIHYGPIASVARVVKDAELRDRLASKLGNLCLEMEAAGLMDNFPCLIIRGISDYAVSHKNNLLAWICSCRCRCVCEGAALSDCPGGN